MIFASKEMIAKAREMDLLTYLRTYDPGELVHISGNHYCTKEHDSLKINGNKWYWFSQGFGGFSALDYLIRVKGMSLPKAVETILGANPNMEVQGDIHYYEPKKKEFIVPELSDSPKQAVNYLKKRGIHPDILDELVKMRLLSETEKYHNVIFFGFDEKGFPRYAALRSINGTFKGEVSGSDKKYAFQLPAEEESKELHVFEAAIDLLSYASLMVLNQENWKEEHLLSTGGVAKDTKTRIPAALSQFLITHPEVKKIHLHLDKDEPGRVATEHIRSVLSDHYIVLDEPAEMGKDINDELCARLGITKGREVEKDER